jgi:uncharacterized membrane protein
VRTGNYWKRESLDEFHLLITLMLLLSGISQVVIGQTPSRLAQIPSGMQTVWSWTLIIAPALILIGSFWPDEEFGLWFELSGMTAIACLATTYGTVVLVVNPEALSTSIGGPLIIAVGLAAFRRSWRVIRRIWISQAAHTERVDQAVRDLIAESNMEPRVPGPEDCPPESEKS